MKTIKQFAAQSSIPEKLIRATVRQFGSWEYFTESAQDITNYGASGGFGQFVYYADTCAFYARNQALIVDYAKQMAEDLGENVQAIVESFNCLRDSATTEEIGQTLWGTKSKHDTQVANALAWFALEEVARSYVDFLEG